MASVNKEIKASTAAINKTADKRVVYHAYGKLLNKEYVWLNNFA